MCFVEEWINPSDSLQLLGWPCQNIRNPIWHPFSQVFFLPDQIPWQHPLATISSLTWRDAAMAFVGLHHWTSLDISSHRHRRLIHSNGSSARESRWVPGKWSIWIKHGKFMKIMENREVRIHPISRVIYSYLNYMGINMGKTSKFPDESTATTPQEAPWNWKSFWRRCWKCCVNMSCWLMSSGVIVILNIIYCVCHTYYIYVLWCNMYIILGSIINPSALLAFDDDISLYSM